MKEIPMELLGLKAFHGHLGPFVILGYRMGILARKRFKGVFYATAFTGLEPPLSCIIDGVQFSSGCTIGRGTLAVVDSKKPLVQFYNAVMTLEMSPLESISKKIDSLCIDDTEEKLAIEIYRIKDDDLLNIKEGGPEMSDRIVKL